MHSLFMRGCRWHFYTTYFAQRSIPDYELSPLFSEFAHILQPNSL